MVFLYIAVGWIGAAGTLAALFYFVPALALPVKLAISWIVAIVAIFVTSWFKR